MKWNRSKAWWKKCLSYFYWREILLHFESHSHLLLFLPQVWKACALIATPRYFGRLPYPSCSRCNTNIEFMLFVTIDQTYTFCVALGYLIIISKYVCLVAYFLVQSGIGRYAEVFGAIFMNVVGCFSVIQTAVNCTDRPRKIHLTPSKQTMRFCH